PGGRSPNDRRRGPSGSAPGVGILGPPVGMEAVVMVAIPADDVALGGKLVAADVDGAVIDEVLVAGLGLGVVGQAAVAGQAIATGGKPIAAPRPLSAARPVRVDDAVALSRAIRPAGERRRPVAANGVSTARLSGPANVGPSGVAGQRT